jgi:Tol biopolymer transport system component
MDNTGANQLRLTNNGTSDDAAKWSPDGTQIVFYTARHGDDEIYVMDADGSSQTRLTYSEENDENPSWAGGLIVFASSRDGDDEIYIMDKTGLNQTRLTINTGGSNSNPTFGR